MATIEVFSYKQNLIDYVGEVLAGHINNKNDLSRYAIVFPGKRPGLYLTNYLVEKIKSSFFPPHIFTTTEFMGYITNNNLTEIAMLDAVYELFNIIKELKIDNGNKNFEKFEDFVPWGIEIFKVIEEFDTELVNENKLKGIDLPDISDNARRLLVNLPIIRKEFSARLNQKLLTTRGLIYRQASQMIKDRVLDEFEHIYFVGLIVLTKAEAEVIKHILRAKNASFFTQIESLNEQVVLNLKQNLEAEVHVNDSLDIDMPTIHLHEAHGTHEEVEFVYQILKDKKPEPYKTAIVLPEPATLLPLLSNVMDYFPYDYNVTMGYPLKRTPLYTLITNVLNAQEKLTSKGHNNYYYAKDYLRVLKHPYIKGMHEQAIHTIVQQIEKYIIDNGEAFISLESIEDIDNKNLYNALKSSLEHTEKPADANLIQSYIKELHSLFFKPFEPDKLTVIEFINAIDRLIQALLKDSSALQYKFSPSFLKGLIDIIEELKCAKFREELFDKQMLFKLFDSYVQIQTIPFNGIPIKGLQILGLLETRVLNFDTVLMLDCNDGTVPSISKYEPLLPLPIKKILNLPTYTEHEQVFRYHFRRLIKTANNVHLIYKKTDDMERSRFIEEIIWDEEKRGGILFENEDKDAYWQDKITFTKRQFRTEIKGSGKSGIKKSKDIMEKIVSILTKGLSPTSIDEYMSCPAKFYYSHILELKQIDVLEEEVEAKDVGAFVHKILELFYQKHLNKTYSYSSSYDKTLEDLIEKEFEKTFHNENNGSYFLLKEIIKELLKKFIKQDGQKNKTTILSLEKHLSAPFDLINNVPIRLKGKVDRIDKKEDEYLIIDYKTGSEANIPKIKKLMDFVNSKTDKALSNRQEMKELIVSFQLPVYLYLFYKNADKLNMEYVNWGQLNASLYMIRDKKDICKPLFKTKDDREGLMEQVFIPSLKGLICEILDPSKPFVHDDTDERACKYCPFSIICK